MIKLYYIMKKMYKKGYIGMSVLKRKKITIVSIVIILLVIISLIIAINVTKKEEEPQEEMLTTVRIQGDNASLNGVVIALDGEVITDEENADTTTFRAEDQEIIITLDSDVAIVNGEETAFVKTTAVVEEVAVDENEAEIEEVKQPITYIDNDEVFVPIEFVEDVFDLEFDDETLEFKRDDEIIIGGEAEELPEVEVIEESQEEELEDEIDADVSNETEEDSEDEEIDAEPSKEESDKVEIETGNNNTNTGSTNTGSNSTTSNNSSSSSGSSNSNSSSGGSTSSNASNSSNNNNTTTSTPTPAQPTTIAVSSITLDKTSVTLEIGGTTKVNATINPSNASYQGINWSSSNTGVATVDGNGNIKAVGSGTATITATSSAYSNIKASLTVTVKQPEPPKQPTYTGANVTETLLNNGWEYANGYGTASFYQDSIVANANVQNQGYDLYIRVNAHSNDGVSEALYQALSLIIPSGASTVRDTAMNFRSQTFEFDGRKVTVESTGVTKIYIYPKY